MRPSLGWLLLRKARTRLRPRFIGWTATGCGLSVVDGSGQIASLDRHGLVLALGDYQDSTLGSTFRRMLVRRLPAIVIL